MTREREREGDGDGDGEGEKIGREKVCEEEVWTAGIPCNEDLPQYAVTMCVVSKAPVFDVRGDKAVIGSRGGKDVTHRQVNPVKCLVCPKRCPDVVHTWALPSFTVVGDVPLVLRVEKEKRERGELEMVRCKVSRRTIQ